MNKTSPTRSISEVQLTADRSFWPVMTPAYNPRAAHLKEMLRSVLRQHPEVQQMHVEAADEGLVDVSLEVRRRIFNKPQVAHHAGQKHKKLLAVELLNINP